MNDNWPRLTGFLDDGHDDIISIEELEPKIAPDDQQTAGFLD
jgi:hypothetical protein